MGTTCCPDVLPRKESTMATSRRAFFGTCSVLVATSIAQAVVSISRAELSGTQLRIESQASPNRTITVDGAAMGTSDGAGKFRIERSGFTAPDDCTLDVNDGSFVINLNLS
jgi:hypothetical protein